ncbi:MAG: RNA polymerase sigma factor [Microgenomates group bacterium]
MTDKELILKIKEGQFEYFTEIFNRYFLKIKKFVDERVFEKQDVDDIVQEAFFKFYKAIDRFDENKDILPYLLEIAKNQVKMYYRSKKTIFSLTERLIAKLPLLNNKTSEENILDVDVNDYLKNLNKREKEIFLMLADGYSYKEISKKTKIPLNTIKSIIRRTRRKLIVNNE